MIGLTGARRKRPPFLEACLAGSLVQIARGSGGVWMNVTTTTEEKTMNRILIIEDDPTLNEGIAMTLEGPDVHLQRAETLKQAREIIKAQLPDLILLDVNLPDGNGFEFCKELRRQTDLPIIFLTANDMELDIVRGLELGGDDYITKPFDMEEVLARIESSLRRIQFQSAVPKRLQYKNLIFDGEKNTVFLNGQELLLTAKELAILELLMRYPDKIFSKANLFQSIWDTEYLNEDNTLNVHISNLRNKMKALCPDEEYIDTVWGIGYRLHKAED